MANIKSAKKRAITNEKSRIRNKSVKTNLKTVEKNFLSAVEQNDAEKAKEAYKIASAKFDIAASKGVIHKKVADRKKSRLAKKAAALSE